METLCQPSSELGYELWWQADVEEISSGGLTLVLKRWFAAGTVLDIDLHNVTTRYSAVCQVRVLHAQQLPDDGSWYLGCAFVKPLSEDCLSALR